MAYRLNLADNPLPIFDQSRLPITNILLVLSFTITDILEIADISVSKISSQINRSQIVTIKVILKVKVVFKVKRG